MSAFPLPLYNVGGVNWEESQAFYHAQAHLGLPALNILWPEQPYVCIGRFQDLEREVDVAECQRRGLPIIRREVGGGAVYLDGNQVFYQLVLPLEWLGRQYNYRQLFRLGLDGVVLALKRLGVNACIRGTNDVVIYRRKISGNGAGEVGKAAVVVGNILLDFDYETMAAVLRAPDEKFRDKAYRSMKENLVTLADLEREAREEMEAARGAAGRGEAASPPAREAAGHSREQVMEALAQAMIETLRPGYAVEPRERLPREVIAFAPEVARRLLREDWLHAVQRRQEGRRIRIREGVEMRERAWKATGGLIRCQSALEGGRITWVSLSGDFFAQPPEALAGLEEALTGLAPDEVKEAAARFLARTDVAIPGVGPEDIERAVTGRPSHEGSRRP